MLVIAWVVLIMNILGGIIYFIEAFTKKTTSARVSSFVGLCFKVMTVYLCVHIIR